MILKLKNNIEFYVDSIVELGGKYEINFREGTTYGQVQPVFDPSSKSFSKNNLREFKLINENTGLLEGTHVGYTDVVNISCINNKVTVLVDRENEAMTEIESLKQENADIYFELMMLSSNI